MMGISIIALIITSSAGILSMLRIQRDSGIALKGMVEQSLKDTADYVSQIADLNFGKYLSQVGDFSMYLHDIYLNPENYLEFDVQPPQRENAGKIVVQRSLKDESIKIEDVRKELNRLANITYVWKPIMDANSDVIETMYIGTESGFLMSYDDQSEYGEEDGGEHYFDHTSRGWYKLAKISGRPVFTNVYFDDYGKGLMITCAAPFNDAKGKFAGVVAMDILITDLYNNLIDLGFGKDVVAFVVDRAGGIIEPDSGALPEPKTLKNAGTMDSSTINNILSGTIGTTLDPNGMYYGHAPVQSTGWRFCIRVPEEVILAPVSSVNRNVIMTIVLFMMSFVIIVFIVSLTVKDFSIRLTEPLAALGHDVEEISGGNLDYRAKIHDNDEIGDLAMSFNNMAASLKEYIANLAHVTAEKERIGAELNVATQIQADMLPRIFPPFPDRNEFDIFASMNPAKEVGGDFYDFFLIDDDHLALVMADVSGKGVPAALFMVIAKTLIKNRALMGGTPSEILHDVNNQLCEGNDADLFVTVWLGILEISTGIVKSANAGHEFPAIKKTGGLYTLQKTKNSPAVATMEDMRFRGHEFILDPGDTLFVYTDGVPEATNSSEILFGNDRMIEALNKTVNFSAEDILKSMKKAVDDFTGDAPQFDDVTMLCLRYFGGSAIMKELNVTAEISNLEKVIAFVDEQLEIHDCSPKNQMQIDIAVEELFVNIARYAYQPVIGPATVRVEIKEHPLSVEVTFIDKGMPYDPLAKPDPDVTLSAEERDIGGLGIYMVKKSMDNISYEYKDGRNILKIEKML